MPNAISTVNEYLTLGCGRCNLFNTPECKVHNWSQELHLLRSIVTATDLVEEIKWGMPCYTYNDKNVAMIGAFKNYCFLSFFKGSLMKDPYKILTATGENSHVAKILKFTSFVEIEAVANYIPSYLLEAINLEKANIKVPKAPTPTLEIPIEFQKVLKENKVLKSAFDALTPGRQRSYLLHFNGAKQSKTRDTRIEKCIPLILTGKGFNEY